MAVPCILLCSLSGSAPHGPPTAMAAPVHVTPRRASSSRRRLYSPEFRPRQAVRPRFGLFDRRNSSARRIRPFHSSVMVSRVFRYTRHGVRLRLRRFLYCSRSLGSARWDRAVRVSVPVACSFDVSIACSRAASRARRQKKRVTRRRGDKKTAAAIAMATSAVILGKRGATSNNPRRISLPIGRGRRGTVPYHARTRREDGHAIIKRRRRRGDNGRPLDGCIMQQRKGTMFDVHDKPVEDLRERMRLLQSDRCVCPFFKRKQAAATSF